MATAANRLVTRSQREIGLDDQLADHRRELREKGYDPDYIGVTEVEPVCCHKCGTQIPWHRIRNN